MKEQVAPRKSKTKTKSVSLPLRPMLVQYLVGLCCLRWDPNAIDVTIGAMVNDAAAKKERDVDVTVSVAESGSPTYAFKAYEVKHEGTPLDVTEVEALCQKLIDMPSITHRAIVSTSDFTTGARAKAAYHRVELYALRPWTRPLQEQFPLLTMQGTAEECFPTIKTELCWIDARCELVAREAKSNFTVQPGDRLLDSSGQTHRRYPSFADYRDELLLRSTEILFPLEPAATIFQTLPAASSAPEGITPAGPSWPYTHTLDAGPDDVYVTTANGSCRLNFVTIAGHLQWRRTRDQTHYYVMERIPDGEVFAGALISTEAREGHMTCLVFSPKTREIGIQFVRLADKHKNAIRGLKVEIPNPRFDVGPPDR